MVLFGLYRVVSPHPDETRGQRAPARRSWAFSACWPWPPCSPHRPNPSIWPLARGLGGFWGDSLLQGVGDLIAYAHLPFAKLIAAILFAGVAAWTLGYALGLRRLDLAAFGAWAAETLRRKPQALSAQAQVPLKPAAPPRGSPRPPWPNAKTGTRS